MIGEVLAAARKRIAKNKKLNENDTKATLIEPVLAALTPLSPPPDPLPWRVSEAPNEVASREL